MPPRDTPASTPNRLATPSGEHLPLTTGRSISSRGIRDAAVVALWTIMLGCLALITLVSPGATRMFAWPWSLAYGGALLAPALLVVLRAFDSRRPLVLPSNAWTVSAAAIAAVIFCSAIASPFRHQSLLWAAPELAATLVFLAVFDGLNRQPELGASRRLRLWRRLAVGFGILAVISLAWWIHELWGSPFTHVFIVRNAHPLGHSNYTAGVGLLMLPGLAVAAARARGLARALAVAGVLFATAMLFSSGSRGEIVGLGMMGVVALAVSGFRTRTKLVVATGVAVGVLLFAAANPRTRAMLHPSGPASPPNVSNVQRNAMLVAGWRMGLDRPLLGWGPGTTPLVFPRYRAGLEGGAENVLQLHSTPVQLWAEFGSAAILIALGSLLMIVRNASRDRLATISFFGYAAFALFDWQLDVPIFGYTLAVFAALLAGPGDERPSGPWKTGLGIAALLGISAIAFFGRRDPAPELNVRALSTEMGRSDASQAIALLRQSLALNPDQEIAHFNLGWLLVVDDPAAAEQHFIAAARLVPDKGGVYFGIGLARLNRGDSRAAAQAFALEAVNDPVFLLSPAWKLPQIAALRDNVFAQVVGDLDDIARELPSGTWTAGEARYVRTLVQWLGRRATAADAAEAANTPERRQYFLGNPDRHAPEFTTTQVIRNQRTGYPVLMRNLDLPPPIDLLAIEQSSVRSSKLGFVFPPKGWAPSPSLLTFLAKITSSRD